MLVKEFDYHLPEELIARYPTPVRDASRLMLLNRMKPGIDECLFSSLPDYLSPGDLLVMNDTRVIPARIFGCKETGGRVELFLLRSLNSENIWECLLRGAKRFRSGQRVHLSSGMIATILGRSDQDLWQVQFSGQESFNSWLEREGRIPLPPYLVRDDEKNDRERYQTVYAEHPGAVAAPTAGLHFTREILARLENSGVIIATLTLHTGIGTFLPVRVERVEDHHIHRERYVIPSATADAVAAARARGAKVCAVGTTTARTLEYAADSNGIVIPGTGEADIFIYPGYRFKVVDALLTNFHLPESTLIMLVSAFAGRENVLYAYEEAISRGFRFYSYGDCMLIT